MASSIGCHYGDMAVTKKKKKKKTSPTWGFTIQSHREIKCFHISTCYVNIDHINVNHKKKIFIMC